MPYFTQLPDTLLAAGIDLQLIPGVIVENLDGLHAPGTRRGTNDVIPGRRGQLGTSKPLDAYAFSIPVTLVPTGDPAVTLAQRRAQTLTTLRTTIAALAGGDGLVTLTRRLATAAGHIETSCAGEFVDGFAVDWLNPETGRTELQFVNLDGAWYAVADTTVTPGTITVAGDIPTRRITLDLPGAGTLTNTTLGVSVTVTTATTLDVATYDATAGIATLTSTGDSNWFVLHPGSNTVTWSGAGTPDIVYRPAYL